MISDRYRIDALIAKGGMGEVYSGYHRYLQKKVAVKVLQPDMEHLPDLVARFEREAIAGAHVDHPNVAAATDFGQLDDGSYFLVVEYARGITLTDLIRRERITPMRAARIARQIASALAAVHEIGIVHRDVKSRNVIVAIDQRDAVKLIDFGLARVRVDQFVSARRSRLDSVPQRITATGEIFGTVAYLAPEAAVGMDAVDARSDLYALGVVFYEMLAGRRPYGAIEAGELFQEQRSPPPRVSERAPGVIVMPELEEVVMRLLARDPTQRYQHAAEVIAAIDAALAQMPSSSTSTALAKPPPEEAVALPVRSIGPAAIALGAFAVVACVALAHLARGGAEPRAAVAAAPPEATTAAPAALATSGVVEAGPLADPSLRRELVRAVRARDQRAGHRALLALVDRDAPSLRDPEVAAAAREVAASLPADGSGDDLLDRLALRGGSPGLDVIYGIVERRGGSRVAAQAAAILRRPEVIAKASPELAIAFAIREAPCNEKLGLLDRAAQAGDARALLTLETQGRACFGRHREVEAAIAALRARLGTR